MDRGLIGITRAIALYFQLFGFSKEVSEEIAIKGKEKFKNENENTVVELLEKRMMTIADYIFCDSTLPKVEKISRFQLICRRNVDTISAEELLFKDEFIFAQYMKQYITLVFTGVPMTTQTVMKPQIIDLPHPLRYFLFKVKHLIFRKCG